MIIQCACGCGVSFEDIDVKGRTRQFVSGHNGKGKHRTIETKLKIGNGNRGKVRSEEVRKKISEIQIGRIPWNKGLRGITVPWLKGKKHSEESKRKMSEAHKGKSTWNKGLKGLPPHSEEHRKKQSIALKGRPHLNSRGKPSWNKGIKWEAMQGERNPHWKGGSRASNARLNFRRRLLGYERLNIPFINSVGHHINREQVIYIPEEFHKKYPHRLSNPETMVQINQIALLYLMDLYTY